MNYIVNFIFSLSIVLMSIAEPLLEWAITEGPGYGLFASIVFALWKYYHWLNTKLSTIVSRSDKHELQITSLETAVKTMDEKFEKRFDKVDARFDKFEERFERLEDKIDRKFNAQNEVNIKILSLLQGNPPISIHKS